MDTNEFLQKVKMFTDYQEYRFRNVAPRMLLGDETTISAQVSHFHYCNPREDDALFYGKVEIGYPSIELPTQFDEYRDGDSHVWGYVPVHLLDAFITEHGGIIGTETLVPDPGNPTGNRISLFTRF